MKPFDQIFLNYYPSVKSQTNMLSLSPWEQIENNSLTFFQMQCNLARFLRSWRHLMAGSVHKTGDIATKFKIFYRAVFKWLSKNQNQSNHFDQSQQEQTAPWTNPNSLQSHVTRSKRGKNYAYMVRFWFWFWFCVSLVEKLARVF